MISFKTYKPKEFNNIDLLVDLINKIDKLLVQPISQRIDIQDYSKKISEKAYLIFALEDNNPVGIIAAYCNKFENSYLTIIGLKKQYQGIGLARKLMNLLVELCISLNSTSINLECSTDLIAFYKKYDFSIVDKFLSNKIEKVKMEKKINSKINNFPFVETKTDFLESVSKDFKNNIFVKRDDLFPLAQGGNKARKLQYILYKAKSEGANAIVTAGDINSNHNRATALMGAMLGMKVKLIVHNENPSLETYSMNLFLSRLSGAEVIYCSKNDVSQVMDNAMNDFEKNGYKPYYIWGGGHCLEGSYAYFDAVNRLSNNIDFKPDFVFVASGTGTTHAGLHVGFNKFIPTAKTYGISIAREKERGIEEIYKSVVELEKYLDIPLTNKDKIIFDDSFVGNSYESIENEVLETIKYVALREGLILDPTYSGKAFNGMLKIIKKEKNVFKNKNILFWNTGGIFNLLTHRDKL
jgi:1-aminocyclopropane-1-carboxylate deaminase/D-cysteine desulfhydrase-like pyridoxal-dependent ACC family enzyme/GNAT superfamily N-acetyltransferase